MKLKMPGPTGIITLASDPDIALRAENKTAALALEALSEALVSGETDPRTPMGPKPLSVRRGAEVARRADRGGTHEQFTQLRSSPER